MRWSRVSLRAAVAVLTALQLAAPAAATEQTFSVTAEPNTCGYISVPFKTRYFDYRALYNSYSHVPNDCIFRLSLLYMEGTCSTLRNNDGSGCGSSSGVRMGASNSSCQAVREDAWVTLFPSYPPDFEQVDMGSLCADSTTGYFYYENTCPHSPLKFILMVQSASFSSCSGTAGLPSWARITIGIICGLIAVALFAYAFRRCGRTTRPGSSPGVVQMAAAPPAGPAGGAYGPAYGGYGGYPPQQPAYAGAWGAAAPPAGSGYGYGGGGYGAYPQAAAHPQHHIPPPMMTVVLGGPETEGAAAGTPAGAAPAGGTGTGAGTASSGGAAAAGGDLGAKV